METKQYPKVKKRFVIGMAPALIVLALVVIAVSIIYSTTTH